MNKNTLANSLYNVSYTDLSKEDSRKDFIDNLVNPSISDENETLKSTSYILYEFEDVKVTSNSNSKNISPLFSENVVSNESNRVILQTLFEDIPFYFLDSHVVIDENSDENPVLQMTRDPSKTDVPTYLQTDFWSVWFTDAWGTINNSIILDTYNKLKYPIMNENQYLNTDVIVNLADNIIVKEDEQRIDFLDTDSEYGSDYFSNSFHKDDENYILKINDIIDEKLQNVYSLLNYRPDYFVYLSDLCDSLVNSSKLSALEVSKEKEIYKLQDIQYELLRRKFAGSATLYNIALASIDRQGGLNRTIELGKFKTSSVDDTIFRDKRKLKILNLPGIITQVEDVVYEPLYSLSEERGNDYGIPMDFVVPLYYTSADQGSVKYDANTFYCHDESTYLSKLSINSYEGDSKSTVNSYVQKFLRENNNIIEWNDLGYVSSAKMSKTYTLALDEKVLGTDVSTDSGYAYNYRQLDSTINYMDENDKTITTKIKLDITIPSYSSSSISGVMFDVNSNKLMFHENTIQHKLKAAYPYITYSIADNNSVSLMDVSVLDYMKSSTENKSRVQDRVDFGTQISYYIEVKNSTESEENFFALGFQDSVDSTDITSTYTNDTNFAVLFYVSVKYSVVIRDILNNVDSTNIGFVVQSVTQKPITRIAFNSNLDISDYESRDLYSKLKNGNLGIIPFTYGEYSTDTSVYYGSSALKVGLIKESDGTYQYYDDANDRDYTVGNFIFSASNVYSGVIGNTSPIDILSLNKDNDESSYTKNDTFSMYPISTGIDDDGINEYDYGALYFCVTRITGSDSIKNYEDYADRLANNQDVSNKIDEKYFWSEPIYYIGYNKIPNVGDSFYPDWKNMTAQFNAYLNTTLNSASPMRYMYKNIPEYLKCVDDSSISNSTKIYTQDSDTFEYNYVGTKSSINGSLIGDNPIYYIKNDKYTVDWDYIHNIAEGVRDGQYGIPFIFSNRVFTKYVESIPNNISSCNEYTIYKGTDGLYALLNGEMTQLHNCDIFTSDVDDDIYESIDDRNYYFTYFKVNDGNVISYIKHNKEFVEIDFDIIAYENIKSFPAILYEQYVYFSYEDKTFYKGIRNALGDPIEISIGEVYNGYTYVYVESSLDNYTKELNTIYFYCNSTTSNSYDDIKTFVWKEERLVKIDNTDSYEITTDDFNIKCFKVNKLSPVSIFDTLNETDFLKYRKYVICYRLLFTNKLTEEESYSKCYTKIFDNISSIFGSDGIDLMNNDSYIYDIRVYENIYDGTNINIDNIVYKPQIMNGSLRQQYTNSSSIMKLGYSVYEDLGIIKNYISFKGLNDSNDTNKPNDITRIRLFNRNKWDSILLDRYVDDTYYEGYRTEKLYKDKILLCDTDIFSLENNKCVLNDCISQYLKEDVESENSQGLINDEIDSVQLKYNNNIYTIDDGSILSIVNTTLYPIKYTKEVFASNGSYPTELQSYPYSTGDKNTFVVKLPVQPAKNSFKYFTDLNLNLTISLESDASIPYNYGDNVEIIYDTDNKKSVVALSDTTIRTNPEKNYILMPLKLPKISTRGSVNYIDLFKIRNFKISSSFSKMLDARAYYNEQIIPLASYDEESNIKYIYKHNAIRLYKEGTYYITAKYPMMILPEFDYDFTNTNYPIVYGTVRFKIVVKGIVKNSSTHDDYSILTSNRYKNTNITSSLNSTSMLYNPTDNRTFPHRVIDIKLYSMKETDTSSVVGLLTNDTEDYNFTWDLIASNDSNDVTSSNGVILLTQDAVKKGLFITNYVNLYLSKNYNMPFFLAKQEKVNDTDDTNKFKYNPLSADDDLIDPIRILSTSTVNENSENISMSSASDIDNIILYPVKDYNLLLDFTSNITEYSYTNKYFDFTSSDLEKERKNYSRLSNVLGASNAGEYMYNKLNNYDDDSYSSYLYGYSIDSSTNTWNIDKGSDSNTFSLGNPYSSLSSDNYALKYKPNNRYTINNSYTFPYIIENYDTNSIGTAYSYNGLISKSIPTYTNTSYGYDLLYSKTAFKEQSSIQRLYPSLLCTYIISSTAPFISEFSNIIPHVVSKASTDESYNYDVTSNNVSNSAFDLYSYNRNSLDIISMYSKNNFTVTSNGLYKNNLIYNDYYFNNTSWMGTLSNGYWYSDSDYGKDVYKVTIDSCINTDNSIDYTKNTVIYSSGHNAFNGTYEIAINVKGNVKVYACLTLLFKKISDYVELSTVEDNDNSWYTYSSEITLSNSYADGVCYSFVTDSEQEIYLGKPIIRLSIKNSSHQLGLSCINLNNVITENKFTIPSCYMLMYKSKINDIYVTVQLKNIINGKYAFPQDISEFITRYDTMPDGDESRLKKLLEPWVRNIVYIECDNDGNKNVIKEYSYVIEHDSLNKKVINTTEICTKLYEYITMDFDTDKENLIFTIPVSGDYSCLSKVKSQLENTFDANLNTSLPFSIENEYFSALTDCFNPSLIMNNKDSNVAITNIQFVTDTEDDKGNEKDYVLYELEYLPIIYNERYYHFSLNFMLNQKA